MSNKPKWGGFLRTMQRYETRDPWPDVPWADDRRPEMSARSFIVYTLLVAAVAGMILYELQRLV